MTPRRLALAMLLTIASPIGVRASDIQYREWLNQCTPGAMQVCASFSLRLEYMAELNRTAISVAISNLQGTPGFEDLELSQVRLVSFYGFEHTGLAPGFGWDQGNFNLLPTVSGAADADDMAAEIIWSDPAAIGAGDTPAVLWAGPQNADGIFGCEVGTWRAEWYPTTCGGSIVIAWDGFRGRLAMTDDLYAELLTYPQGTGFAQCRTDADCITRSVPEPSTLLLLATGLLGVAYVRRRRAA